MFRALFDSGIFNTHPLVGCSQEITMRKHKWLDQCQMYRVHSLVRINQKKIRKRTKELMLCCLWYNHSNSAVRGTNDPWAHTELFAMSTKVDYEESTDFRSSLTVKVEAPRVPRPPCPEPVLQRNYRWFPLSCSQVSWFESFWSLDFSAFPGCPSLSELGIPSFPHPHPHPHPSSSEGSALKLSFCD